MSSFELTPTVESTTVISINSQCGSEKVLPWGRLFSKVKSIEGVDLVNFDFKFGRGVNCDVTVTKSNFPVNTLAAISKCHFVITKEDDGPAFITDTSKNGTFLNGNLIGKGKKNVLQSNDEIATGFKGLPVFVYKDLQGRTSTYLPPKLRDKYEVDRLLGQGACGEVRLIYEKSSCKQFAVKRINKSSASQVHRLNHPSKIETEVNILELIDHPCIINVREICETKDDYFIVMDYMKGGELTSRILSMDKMDESLVRFYFYQMLLAVRHLHRQGIMHRDIKSDNMLLQSGDKETLLKVSDFGLSKIIDEETVLKTVCGTPSYVAPEVLDRFTYKTYGQKADIWSLGVLLFYMLSGEMPFRGHDTASLAKAILTGKYSMEGGSWANISSSAKDLIRKMLVTNPKIRIDADDIFEHRWLNEDASVISKLDNMLQRFGYVLTETESNTSFEPSQRILKRKNMDSADSLEPPKKRSKVE